MSKRQTKPKQPKQPDRDALMLRTRAAVAYTNAKYADDCGIDAFMAIFHPEVTDDRLRNITRDVKEKRRGGW